MIDDDHVLSQYHLASKWDRDSDHGWVERIDKQGLPVLQKSQPPEILFIERCIQLLKPGVGRMAMVIPNGILNNPALGYVRFWLMRNVQILAVIDMARELFQPKNDTQTSMVLMRRLNEEERTAAVDGNLNYPVFMAVTEKVGHDKRGNTLYRRTPEGDDLLEENRQVIAQIDAETGDEVLKEVSTWDRRIDDELPEVAVDYAEWLESRQ